MGLPCAPKSTQSVLAQQYPFQAPLVTVPVPANAGARRSAGPSAGPSALRTRDFSRESLRARNPRRPQRLQTCGSPLDSWRQAPASIRYPAIPDVCSPCAVTQTPGLLGKLYWAIDVPPEVSRPLHSQWSNTIVRQGEQLPSARLVEIAVLWAVRKCPGSEQLCIQPVQ